jgi:hypothetical protein
VIAAVAAIAMFSSLGVAFHHFVDFRVIPTNQQRYPTAGDWWFDSHGSHFRVSKLPKRRYEWLVFIHEFTEAELCRLSGVSEARVDAFDIAYEERRSGKSVAIPGKTDNILLSEPGDDPAAPYHYQHLIASAVERVAAVLLFVNWRAYNEAVDALARAAIRPGEAVESA